MPPPQRPVLLRALMGLFVAAVFLGTTELVLRLALGPAPNPVQVYGALGDHDQFFRIESDLATRLYGEHPLAPFAVRSDVPRIGVLGGSSMREGTPDLPPDREVPGLLATALGVPVENLAAPGLDSHDLVEITDELGAMDFAALVVYTGHNDLGNAMFESRYGTLPSALYAHVYGGLSHLQLFSQLSRALVPRTGTDRRTRPDMVPEQHEIQPLDPMRRAVTLVAFRKNLQRIAWLTERRGQPLVLVVPISDLTALPATTACEPGDCASDYFDRARDLHRTDPTAAVDILRLLRDTDPACVRAPTTSEDIVREVAAEFDHITLVDPFPLLPRDPSFDIPNRRLFIDPVHFSPEGHRELAGVLEGPLRTVLALD
jgi:lysophospholipase L1-like esterase